MNGTSTLINLVLSQNSSDNNVRIGAEMEFNRLAAENPSQVAHELVRSCAHESSFPIDVKQSCLLHLKRLVPKFWSMGFPSFIGPPIQQETKSFVREGLIMLATSSTSSRIRSGSAYVIVQIAATDFPDEWPDLLDTLYNRAIENQDPISVMGCLAVLNDLFDDLISEEQFWEGGVGNKLIGYITYLLEQPNVSSETKISAVRLYLTVLNTLSSTEALESEERKTSVISHIKFAIQLFLSLIKESINTTSSSDSVQLVHVSLRSHLYQVFSRVLSSFMRQISPSDRSSLVHYLGEDLWYTSKIFKELFVDESKSVSIVKIEEQDDIKGYISSHITHIFETFSVLQGLCCIFETLGPEKFERFFTALAVCSQYPKATIEDYTDDFNAFVTDATGLSSNGSARDSIAEFLTELNGKDSTRIFEFIKSQPAEILDGWVQKETLLFLSEGLFSNQEATSLKNGLSLTPYLESLSLLISPKNAPHPLLTARIFLLIPKALEKFSPENSIESLGSIELEKIFANISNSAEEDNKELIIASALISTTYWRNIENFEIQKLGKKLQASILKACYALFEDSEEDTLPILLEAISVAIGIDNHSIFEADFEENLSVVDLILQISFKDPANVQVTIDSSECFESLVKDVGMDNFLQVCKKSLPALLDVSRMTLTQPSVEFSPELYLSLDLLGSIIEASPFAELPNDIFFYIFPVLKELILKTNDDQILQNAGEVFNKLMQKNENLFINYSDPQTNQTGLEILLAIVSKFLSPELSDSAAMHCGLIVITLFERFQSCLDDNFFLQLLEATVKRVAIAQECITIENLIMVFCKLVLNTSPLMLVDVLLNMEMKDASGNVTDGLRILLPIWFESFEEGRGIERIQQNILALGKIYSLGDARLESLKVDGDIIPEEDDVIITRSMAKVRPPKFTQVSVPHKILKLLIGELGFQGKQPDPEDYVVEKPEAGDDQEGWEDMDDLGVPNYEKLRSYIESDDEEEGESSDKSIRDILIQFFKECVSKNVANFQSYYELLNDEEKTTLSEYIIFT
ncbi:hypothetical protein JCM33374_g3651 [Metschnikowia sp. JCM 33374]|nr:hypothetical protein JCM33374_g3651 [Metschnikowia sp. JCM 33374]